MYVVTAPLVVAKQPDGSYVHIYRGAPLPEETDTDQIDQLLADEMIEEAPDPDPDPEADQPEEATSPRRGRKAADQPEEG